MIIIFLWAVRLAPLDRCEQVGGGMMNVTYIVLEPCGSPISTS